MFTYNYIVYDNLHDIVYDIITCIHDILPDVGYNVLYILPHKPFFSQIKLINKEITSAKHGNPLYRKSLLEDPSERIVQSHLATLEWHMQSRKFGMTAAELERLQCKSVEVLELLKSNFPEKNVVTNPWKFEKAYSILHKVRELILFGWSENFSTQGPEHCHIDFVKKIAIMCVRVIYSIC